MGVREGYQEKDTTVSLSANVCRGQIRNQRRAGICEGGEGRKKDAEKGEQVSDVSK